MSQEHKLESSFVGYEYHSIAIECQMVSVYIDSYENFSWICDGALASEIGSKTVNMKFKQDRKICNKGEFTRLQRQFDTYVGEIVALEKSKKSYAIITAFTIDILGCTFLGSATFAYLAGMMPLMIILEIPGFIG